MHHELPDDLSRLGDELTAAAARGIAARRHRAELAARLAGCAAAAAVALAALAPGTITPSDRAGGMLLTSERAACWDARGEGNACVVLDAGPMVLHRPYAWR